MSAQAFEAFLARIYVDEDARTRFRSDPRGEATRAGLSPEECSALQEMDWPGFELAVRSFATKRGRKDEMRTRTAVRRWVFFARKWFVRTKGAAREAVVRRSNLFCWRE